MKGMYSVLLSCVSSLALLTSWPTLTRAGEALPSANEILQRLLDHNGTPRPASKAYFLCTKQTVDEEMDRGGRVTSRKIKVGESRSQPNNSTDARKWGGQNGVSFDRDLLQRFDFTVQKREMLNGRSTFLLTFVPKTPAWPVRRLQDRLLNRAAGSLWIDEQEAELVKADLYLSEPVSFGILGAADVIRFSFERSYVSGAGWLTHWIETNFKGRKFVIPIQVRRRVDCSDYKAEPPSEQGG
jgi:hypothetical protein